VFGWNVVVVVVVYDLVLDMTQRLCVRRRVGWSMEVNRAGVFCNPGRRIIEL
jgi:hypothetical protein